MLSKIKTFVGISIAWFILIASLPTFGATIIYTYDDLNRLVGVQYSNSSPNEDLTSPYLAITSHTNNQHVMGTITLAGTASDGGSGNNGISQVTVNGVRANNDTASGNGTANWSKLINLNPGPNTITVVAIDNSPNQNSAAQTITLYADNYPPTPNPMTWATLPYAAGSTSISMTATTASDSGYPPASYYFHFVDSPTGGSGGLDSGWQSSSAYTGAGLQPNHQYGYQVKAGNTVNETAYSTPVAYKYTLANIPGIMAFSNVTQTSIRANWSTNGNRSGTAYFCENITAGTNSGWTPNPYWDSIGLYAGSSYSFRVKSRNGDGIETTWVNLGSQSTTNPTVQFSTGTYEVNEKAGTAVITVSLSNPSDQQVTVNYATSNGSATAGNDYISTSGQIIFSPHETTKTFSVTILWDGTFESFETVNLNLSNPINSTLGSTNQAILQIIDSAHVDFNGDGYSDILWRHAVSGELAIWLMNGTSHIGGGSLGIVDLGWKIENVGDFNGDGYSDILWRHVSSGQVVLWLINGTSHVGGGSLGIVDLGWKIENMGDFNGDGKADILWRHVTSGQAVLWLMNGPTYIGGGSLGIVDLGWKIEGVGDFNGDGKADILWRHVSSGQVYIWLLNGTVIIGQGSPSTVDLGWKIEGVGDFGGDGKADILWRHVSSGQVYIWLLNGTVVIGQGSPGTVGDPNWEIIGVGDFNADRNADILWRYTPSGWVYIWLMNGTTYVLGGSPGTEGDSNWKIVAPK